MKNLSRLTVLVVILASLALVTGIASARGLPAVLGIDLRGDGTPEDNSTSTPASGVDLRGDGTPEDSATSTPAAGVDLRGDGTPEDNGASSSQSSDGETEFTGTLESLTSEWLIVSGTQIALTQTTEIEDSLSVGDLVKVHAYTAADGTLTAREVELFDGSSDDMSDDSDDMSDDDMSDDDSDDMSGDDDSDDMSDDDMSDDDSDNDDSDDDSSDDDSSDDDDSDDSDDMSDDD